MPEDLTSLIHTPCTRNPLFPCQFAELVPVVEINLRLPSMLHGKKGFDRLVWAAKNVLNQSLTWLFVDLDTGNPFRSAAEVPLAVLTISQTLESLLMVH